MLRPTTSCIGSSETLNKLNIAILQGMTETILGGDKLGYSIYICKVLSMGDCDQMFFGYVTHEISTLTH